jgi:hypothetical protein
VREHKALTVRARGPDRLPLLALLRLFNHTAVELTRRFQGCKISLVRDAPTRLARQGDEAFGVAFLRGIAALFRGKDPMGRLPRFEVAAAAALYCEGAPASPTAAADPMSAPAEEKEPLGMLRSEMPVLDQFLEDMEDENMRRAVLTLGTIATAWPSSMGSMAMSMYGLGGTGYCYGE